MMPGWFWLNWLHLKCKFYIYIYNLILTLFGLIFRRIYIYEDPNIVQYGIITLLFRKFLSYYFVL